MGHFRKAPKKSQDDRFKLLHSPPHADLRAKFEGFEHGHKEEFQCFHAPK